MPAHQITFGPVGPAESGQDVHLVNSGTFQRAELTCPDCGERLWVHYRVLAPKRLTPQRTGGANVESAES